MQNSCFSHEWSLNNRVAKQIEKVGKETEAREEIMGLLFDRWYQLYKLVYLFVSYQFLFSVSVPLNIIKIQNARNSRRKFSLKIVLFIFFRNFTPKIYL